jgi:hypothetical protein
MLAVCSRRQFSRLQNLKVHQAEQHSAEAGKEQNQ